MDKYFATTHIHPYSWDMVANGIFRRYPNPCSNHVLSEDTIHRELRNNGRLLYTRRFLTKTNKLPQWGESLFANLRRIVPLVEESYIDLETRRIVTYTRNVGLSRFMSAVERVSYMANPDNPMTETMAIKEAWIESGLYGLRTAIKNYGMERFKENCKKATEGFNYVLQQLAQQKHYSHTKWQELKVRRDTWRHSAIKVADRAKAHSLLQAESPPSPPPSKSQPS